MGPVKKLERLLSKTTNFISIDEFKTSQKCSCMLANGVCGAQLQQARLSTKTGRRLMPLDKLADKTDIIRKCHDVKFCPNCLTVSYKEDPPMKRMILEPQS